MTARLFRPAQDDSGAYGRAMVINEVLRLTPEAFDEVVATRLGPFGSGRYPLGPHTLSAAGDRTLLDGKRRVPSWSFRLRRAGRRIPRLQERGGAEADRAAPRRPRARSPGTTVVVAEGDVGPTLRRRGRRRYAVALAERRGIEKLLSCSHPRREAANRTQTACGFDVSESNLYRLRFSERRVPDTSAS